MDSIAMKLGRTFALRGFGRLHRRIRFKIGLEGESMDL